MITKDCEKISYLNIDHSLKNLLTESGKWAIYILFCGNHISTSPKRRHYCSQDTRAQSFAVHLRLKCLLFSPHALTLGVLSTVLMGWGQFFRSYPIVVWHVVVETLHDDHEEIEPLASIRSAQHVGGVVQKNSCSSDSPCWYLHDLHEGGGGWMRTTLLEESVCLTTTLRLTRHAAELSGRLLKLIRQPKRRQMVCRCLLWRPDTMAVYAEGPSWPGRAAMSDVSPGRVGGPEWGVGTEVVTRLGPR